MKQYEYGKWTPAEPLDEECFDNEDDVPEEHYKKLLEEYWDDRYNQCIGG